MDNYVMEPAKSETAPEATKTARVAALWLPTFATDRASLRRPAWRSKPLAVITAAHGGIRLAAVNAPAASGGLVPGLTLAAARAIVPNVETTPADPDRDARALERLADWCGRYTPWTAAEPPSEPAAGAGVWLDVTGCGHLFDGEDTLLEDLLARVRGQGFAARAALADTPGAAWGVARYGGEGGDGIVVAPGAHRQTLKALPVAALRPGAQVNEGLDRLGVRRVGDLYDLPRGPLAARFGEGLLNRLDQALGRQAEPVSPRLPVTAHRVRLAFPEAIGQLDDVAAGLARLLDHMAARLAHERLGLRRAEFTLYRSDGGIARAAVGTGRPVRDPGHLQRLFAEHLDKLDLGFGVDVMTLAAPVVEPLAAAQLDLSDGGRGGGFDRQQGQQVDRLVDRLETRLGRGSVVRLENRASHIPERAGIPVSALSGRTPPDSAPELTSETAPARSVRPRPLRLFPQPQAIEAVAEVPDGPPVLFRWRRLVHRVVHAEGPERIAAEWWRDKAPPGEDRSHLTRDYYRIEDTEGRRFWLFREGLYLMGEDEISANDNAPEPRPTRAPRWFIHGVFA